MPRIRNHNEPIERVTLKLSKSVATYFRKAFGHGRRSEFVAQCLKRHQREQEIKSIEANLSDIGRERL